MADISSEISAFQNAVYGEEVRGSMISLAEKLNDVCEDCEDTVDTLEAGYDAAMEAAATATTAANTATSNANTAATSASNAASSANTATTNANNAASNATSKANAADALSTSVQNAENARVAAEASRVSAENARVTAENARAGSEANRQSAESTRTEAETARNSAEISRVSAEATRAANETSRQSAETSRVSAESNRATTFAAMQASFADMEQQVLPPATYTTLGGVIIDQESGLEVDSDGVLSFTSGDFLTTEAAAATYATITTVNGKANASHVHAATDITSGTLGVSRGGTGVTTAAAERERLGLGSTTDALPIANGGTGATTASGALSAILNSSPLPVANGGTGLSTTASGAFYSTSSGGTPSFGTLPVAQGGTGATTLTANGILKGDGTSAVSAISTASGALYATSANGAASFGTLPIAQGGTGSTSASSALTALGALPLSGGTLTGNLTLDGGTATRSIYVNAKNFEVDTAPSSTQYVQSVRVMDSDNDEIGHIEWGFDASKNLTHNFAAVRQKVNGTFTWKQSKMTVSPSGTVSYSIEAPSAFCDAINVGTYSSKDQSTAVNIANGVWANVTSLSLSAGTWLIFATMHYNNNATGVRTAVLSSASGDPSGTERRFCSEQVYRSDANFPTYLNCSRVWVLSSTTTIYLKAYQNSGSTIETRGCIFAARVR